QSVEKKTYAAPPMTASTSGMARIGPRRRGPRGGGGVATGLAGGGGAGVGDDATGAGAAVRAPVTDSLNRREPSRSAARGGAANGGAPSGVSAGFVVSRATGAATPADGSTARTGPTAGADDGSGGAAPKP